MLIMKILKIAEYAGLTLRYYNWLDLCDLMNYHPACFYAGLILIWFLRFSKIHFGNPAYLA